MPLKEEIAKKAQEIAAHDALCNANSALRAKLEKELEPIAKKLENLENILELNAKQVKTSTDEIVKIKARIAKATGPDKKKFEELQKAEEKKLKAAKDQVIALPKIITPLKGEKQKNAAAWEKAAAEVKGLGARKTALAGEMAALQARKREADAIDALTWADILPNQSRLLDLGAKTFNEEIVAFLINGPRGDFETYKKFLQNDDINLSNALELKKEFARLGAQGAAADWAHAPWKRAYDLVLLKLQQDGNVLLTYKSKLKAEKHVN